jgi:RNA polymerase sigma factor (sigma-70 family)
VDLTNTSADWAERLAQEAPWLRLLVAHLAGRSLRARVEIEDLVQEVFVRALARPALFAAPRAASGENASEMPMRRTLALLARECVVDAARAVRAAKRGSGGTDLRLGASGSRGLAVSALRGSVTGPATAAARGETGRELVAAFLRLSPEHRRVIGLRQLEGFSAAETARRTGRSETAVHSLYRRALQAWAEELGGDPPV